MATQSANMRMSVTSYDAVALAQSITNAPDGRHPHYGRNDGPPGAISAEEVDEGRYVHPDSHAMYQKCGPTVGNFCRYMPIFGPAVESYGPRFVFTLNATQFLAKGIAYSMLGAALNPMFKRRFHADTLEYQRYYVVSRMGWSIKPFTALVSDAFAVFWYKKRWILAFSALLSFVTALVFAFLPATHSSCVPGAFLAFLVGYGQANIDILSEGLYARKIRAYPAAGPDLVSSVWVVQMFASMIGCVTQGPLSDNGLAWVGLIICGVCMALCFPLLVLNWMEEDKNRVERMKDEALMRREAAAERTREAKPQSSMKENAVEASGLDGEFLEEPQGMSSSPGELKLDACNLHDDIVGDEGDEDEELYIPTYCGGAIEFNKEVVVRNWRITMYCMLMTAVVVTTAVITTLYEGAPQYITAFVCVAMILFMMFWSLPSVVAKAGLFAFLNCALYIDVTSPMEGFLLVNDACDSSYPQFSLFFFNTVSGMIGNVAGLVGVIAFSFIFSKHSYRLAFIVTTLVYLVASLFDIIIVQRWNIDIGIPDHYFYVFGDAVAFQFAYMLNWMPMSILLAQLCPRGSEAMVYALLAAMTNYGQTIAGVVGELLIQYVWKVDTETCQFQALWKLILLGHCALPSLQFPLVFLLIPGTRICEELDQEGKAVSTKDGEESVLREPTATEQEQQMMPDTERLTPTS